MVQQQKPPTRRESCEIAGFLAFLLLRSAVF